MFVVTLPPSAAKDPVAYAKRAKTAGAALIEIRGDKTPHVSAFASELPLLLSPRGAGQAFVNRHTAAYVDLELGEELAVPAGAKLIRSYHDHQGTPSLEELKGLMDRLRATGAVIHKIAVTINTYEDLEILTAFQVSQKSDDKTVILGMGLKAHLHRLLSPLRNALTYTYLDEGEHAAPGQIPLREYATVGHCTTPALFGLLGGMHITQSLSPLIHNTLNAKSGIDAAFGLFPTDDLQDAWKHLTAMGVAGFSVTSPWKRDIVGALDDADPLVSTLGAANTVVRHPDGWVGYNTDVAGFLRGYALRPRKTVAIVGSGGVVPAVIEACRQAEASTITVHARNPGACADLRDRFDVGTAGVETLALTTPHVIVCAVTDDVSIPLPPPREDAIAIDLRYARDTKFLADAKRLGYATHDGLPMLIEQALEQFRLFHGYAASPAAVSVLRQRLSSSFPA